MTILQTAWRHQADAPTWKLGFHFSSDLVPTLSDFHEEEDLIVSNWSLETDVQYTSTLVSF